MRFWEAMRLAAGLEAKGNAPTHLVLDKVALGAGPMKIEWKGAVEISADEVLIARIISDSFLERRVMYERLDMETGAYAQSSIEQIYALLDGFITKYHGSTSSKDIFYAELLLNWRRACRTAIQALRDAEKNEEEDRAAYRRFELLESSDIIRVDDVMPQIIGAFRRESYPALSALLDLLPEHSQTRAAASPKLTETKRVLLNTFRGEDDPLLEPSWSLELGST